jgi:hypothetical protein
MYFSFLKRKDVLKLSEVSRELDLSIRVTYFISRMMSVVSMISMKQALDRFGLLIVDQETALRRKKE